ncbi:capreomycidine synthase [Streptosporangiaceae bacterium NEAU-GS5]|nr:capreomycidine synthase [Streptosporangiaceae bacterium NEAU-GS5]
MSVRSAEPRTVGDIAPALLEDWLRERYFSASIDISSSGVQDYTLGDLRRRLGISTADLDAVAFRDSPSLGCEPLREAVAARTGRPAGEVMVTHGSSEALFLALAALIRPGDEIVVLRPVYQSLSSIAEVLGARLRTWTLHPADDFRPDLDRLRAVLTERTRAVLVNFPHNPTGVTLTPGQYAEFLEILRGHPGHLVWDAAFSDLTYDQPPLPDPGLGLERVISVGTLSKAYGLPGLRVGWCLAPAALLPAMTKIRDYLTISTSPLAEMLATAVLRQPESVLGPRLRQARENREALLAWARENTGRVSLPRPAGGVSAFPAFSGVDDVTGLCHRLEERGVLVVPGACFGHPDRMRIGFGGFPQSLRTGLDVLTGLLKRPPTPFEV